MKKLKDLFQKDKNIFVVPKTAQDVIPVNKIYKDGIFQVGRNEFSKSYKFTDINYAAASHPDKEAMFIKYSEIINSFDPGARSKITILNRKLNKLDYENNIKIPLAKDGLDSFREEYNEILMDKALGTNSVIQEKYLTITINKKQFKNINKPEEFKNENDIRNNIEIKKDYIQKLLKKACNILRFVS